MKANAEADMIRTKKQYVPWRNTVIKLTPHDETKKRAHDSEIVRAKENLKLSHGLKQYVICTHPSGWEDIFNIRKKTLLICIHLREVKRKAELRNR